MTVGSRYALHCNRSSADGEENRFCVPKRHVLGITSPTVTPPSRFTQILTFCMARRLGGLSEAILTTEVARRQYSLTGKPAQLVSFAGKDNVEGFT